MGKMLTTLVLFFSMTGLFAGPGDEVTLVTEYIRIVDAQTGEPLIGVEVTMACKEQSYYTDPDGVVEISYTKEQGCDLALSYISYQDLIISVAELSSEKEIALDSQ